jgi:hypothetical protein
MNKRIITLGVLLLTSLLMAGGNISSTKLSKVTAIPSYACQTDRVYKDREQHLLWQDQAYTDAEEGAFKRQQTIGKAGNHAHAVRYCARLQYGGYADWRLPTSDELSRVHHKIGQHFTYFRDNDFWSSTPTTEGRYYVVFPADAIRYARSPKQSNYIRCVRCYGEKEVHTSAKPPFRAR